MYSYNHNRVNHIHKIHILIYRANETMSSSNQTLDTSSSIQKRQIPSVETTTNTLDGNSHDANSHDANNQGANTLDANSHDANSHDANNNDANTLDANNQHQSNSVQEKETIFQYTKVYDNATDSYYYWDEVTDETTWEIPEEYLKLNGDEHRKKLKAKEDEEYFNSKEYHDWYYTQYYPSLCNSIHLFINHNFFPNYTVILSMNSTMYHSKTQNQRATPLKL